MIYRCIFFPIVFIISSSCFVPLEDYQTNKTPAQSSIKKTSLQGQWLFKSSRIYHCRNGCKVYYRVPGYKGKCYYRGYGYVYFSSNVSGRFVNNVRMVATCNGLRVKFNLGFRARFHRIGNKLMIGNTGYSYKLSGNRLTLSYWYHVNNKRQYMVDEYVR